MVTTFFTELRALLSEGGWVLICLLVLAFGIAVTLLSIFHQLRSPNAPVLSGPEWRRLLSLSDPPEALLERLQSTLGSRAFEKLDELEHALFKKLERRIPFAFTLSSTAPLAGLLGTVSGMFVTFDGMSRFNAQSPIDTIASGVSEALITTQAGLIIGVPAFIFCALMHSRFQGLRTHFEQVRAILLQRHLQNQPSTH